MATMVEMLSKEKAELVAKVEDLDKIARRLQLELEVLQGKYIALLQRAETAEQEAKKWKANYLAR